MSYFSKVYDNIKKELLSEQGEQVNNDPEMEPEMAQETLQSSEEEPTISNDEPSEIKNIEKDTIKVDWLTKTIKLLTLLNREDENVESIISKLSQIQVNADTLEQTEKFIDELIRTIPVEKNN